MSHFNTIFHQLQQLIPGHQFEEIVKRHEGDRYSKKFNCKNQLLVMLYAQASEKDSLRDINLGLSIQQNHLYHLGIKSIARSTISHANANRNYQIYEELFYKFLSHCQNITPVKKFRFKNPLYSLDTTTIDLCLELFPWAKFRQTKGAIKLHTLFNNKTQIPEFIVITDGKPHEIKVAKNTNLPILSDSILIMDKGFIDYQWLSSLTEQGVFWVTRSKVDMKFDVIGQHKPISNSSCLKDEIIELKSQKYPKPFRRIEWLDKKTNKIYIFITNNLELAASTIAKIYKSRWDIELFFKWIKQNLKIKTFLGASENAVKSQIWIAMIYYLLLAYIKYQTKYSYSLLEFSRIIKESLFFKRHLIDLLSLKYEAIKKIRDPDCQLSFLF